MNCPTCQHGDHAGRMCGDYITRTFRDDVSFTGSPPSGLKRTVIDRVCECVQILRKV